MPQSMACGTQSHQVFGFVGPALAAGFEVVDFEETGVVASRCGALVPVAGQNPSSRAWGNGGGVATAGHADRRIALNALHPGMAETPFSRYSFSKAPSLGGRHSGGISARTLMTKKTGPSARRITGTA